MRRLLALVAILGIASLIVWALWPVPASVELGSVEQRPFQMIIEAEGKSRIREVYAVSSPVPGRVLRINLHAGDMVEKGQAVATMTPTMPAPLDARDRQMALSRRDAARATVDLAEAQRRQSIVQLGRAEDEYRRTQKLARQGLVPDREYARTASALQEAAAAVDSAEALLQVRRGELRSAESLLNGPAESAPECCISVVAPVSGIVLKVASENEQVLAAGMPIMEIGDPGDIEIEAEVLSRDAVQVTTGQRAEISDWGGPTLPAQVARVEPAAITRVSALGIEEQRVPVLLALEQKKSSAGKLGHGFRVTVGIIVRESPDTLTIPVSALFRKGSSWQALVVRDNSLSATPITVGELNNTFAEVTSGVSAGDKVVLHPNDTLDDGDAVVPMTSP